MTQWRRGTIPAQTFKGKRIKLLFVQPLSIFGFCYSSQTYTLSSTQCYRPYTAKICMLNPISHMMAFGGWGSGRSRGQSFHEWDQCPYKTDPRELPCPFHHVRTQGEDGKQALARNRICQNLDLGLPDLQNCEREISVVFRTPSLWYFCCSSQID